MDLARLIKWRPALVISMTPLAELVQDLPCDLAAAGVAWLHLPVADFGVPEAATGLLWPKAQSAALDHLRAGNRVLVHCHGGCGRSGMACLRLMIAAGERADTALARLRAVRSCAVETRAQMAWALAVNNGGVG